MDQPTILLVSVFLVIAAVVLMRLARQQKRKTGLPRGRIIYSDTQGWVRLERPLFDPELNLTGKPDYLVEHNGQVIPVEVKSSRGVIAPYDAHIYQLAAYCLLVMRHYGKRPGYGILHYPDKTFQIDFSNALEAEVTALVADMRSRDGVKNLDRSHQLPQRCSHCGYRFVCDQVLRI
jgi:CRISPR-associated exonuclease Cas4